MNSVSYKLYMICRSIEYASIRPHWCPCRRDYSTSFFKLGNSVQALLHRRRRQFLS